VLGSTIQVAHSHPDGDIAHADCSLCLATHVVAQVAGSPMPVPAALVVASVEEALPDDSPATLSVFALFTRPPPAVSNLT
jgi:hypothetical protein